MPIPNPIATFPKDPTATLDFTVDWTDFLGDDSILTSTWSVDGGITIATTLFSRVLAIIWLAAGTAGTNYNATNHITTLAGRADSRTIRIAVTNR